MYFACCMGLYFGIGVLGSASLYPGGFSMLTVYISYLGGSEENPAGFIIYNTCAFLTGMLLIPHFIHTYRRLTPTMKVVSFIACIAGIEGYVGFALIGIWYQGVPGQGHAVTTWMAFGGFGVAAVFLLIVLVRKMVIKSGWPKPWQFAIIYGQIFLVLILAELFTNHEYLFDGMGIPLAFFGDRWWEWWYMFTVLFWLIGLCLITPGTMQQQARA